MNASSELPQIPGRPSRSAFLHHPGRSTVIDINRCAALKSFEAKPLPAHASTNSLLSRGALVLELEAHLNLSLLSCIPMLFKRYQRQSECFPQSKLQKVNAVLHEYGAA